MSLWQDPERPEHGQQLKEFGSSWYNPEFGDRSPKNHQNKSASRKDLILCVSDGKELFRKYNNMVRGPQVPPGMHVCEDTILGKDLFSYGPQFKYYVFGAKFTFSNWNKQVSGFIDKYWESFDDLDKRPLNSDHIKRIMSGLVKVGVTFWQPTDRSKKFRAPPGASCHFRKLDTSTKSFRT